MKSIVLIILIVMFWLPLMAIAQTDTLAKPTKIKPLEPIARGIYFGFDFGPFVESSLKHRIPKDTVTGYFVSGYKSKYSVIETNQPILILNTKLVLNRWLIVDIQNNFRSLKGTVTFSKISTSGGGFFSLFGSSSFSYPVDEKSLNLITHSFLVNPNICYNVKGLKTFIGGGFGKSYILRRSGSLDKKYSLNQSSNLYQINIGFCFRIGRGVASYGIVHRWSGEMASSNWNVYQQSTYTSFGYAWPIYTITAKPTKTPTL